MGASPPWTPCFPPPLAWGLPASWVPLVAGFQMGATRPLFFILRANPPSPLPWGLAPPWTSHLPTPVGLGFASVLGPTRGGVSNVGDSPPLFGFVGGHPPPWGFRPPGPPVSHPRWLGVCQRSGSHSWRGFKCGQLAPLFFYFGGTSPTPPAMGACAPLDPPFAHPRWLRVCWRFGSHSWRGC